MWDSKTITADDDGKTLSQLMEDSSKDGINKESTINVSVSSLNNITMIDNVNISDFDIWDSDNTELEIPHEQKVVLIKRFSSYYEIYAMENDNSVYSNSLRIKRGDYYKFGINCNLSELGIIFIFIQSNITIIMIISRIIFLIIKYYS